MGAGALSRKLVPVEGAARWLDRFELVAELATGGMATVFLGRISGAGGFQRFVAIKRLHPHLAREPEFIEMFLDEARLAARIHHPHVVPILEIGTSEQGYYIVMEYVEGDTLAHLISRSVQRGKPLPTNVASRIVVDILSGLHAAHELTDDDGLPLGIVHRDVSPQNILVGVDGSARLTDFGVARATSKLSTTRTGQLKGKLAYMAPEQARSAKDIDRRADLFAAGIVLWEALEGRRLFRGDAEADILHKVLNEPIPALGAGVASVPAELAIVLQGALDRDRDKRFATAAAFADALEKVTRELDEVGTHKDVAAYLDATLGPEIAEQRETVRSWIARNEPSPRSLSMPPPAVSATMLPRVSQRPLPPERTPSSGSSVATALITNTSMPRSTTSDPPGGPPRAGERGRPWQRWLVVAVLGAAATAAGLWLTTSSEARVSGRRPAGAENAGPAGAQALSEASVPPQAPSTLPVPSLAFPAPSPPQSSSASPVAPLPAPTSPIPAALLGSASSRAAHAPHGSSTISVTGPAGTASVRPLPTATVPDDISRNPYR